MGLASVDQALAILHRGRVPNFAFPERAASTLAAMISRQKWLEQSPDLPTGLEGIDHGAAKAALADKDLAAALNAYGIALPPMRLVKSANEAVHAAGVIGYPVVMKLQSSDISHKSDAGGVLLGLNSDEVVRSAYEKIHLNAKQSNPSMTIDGILIQKMLKGGLEMIVGVRRDPQFGPMILVGSGGIEVELRPDVAMGIAPLSRQQAERLLDETYASIRLAGWRGSPPADREAVIDVMQRVAQIACDYPEIVELEINPLYTMPIGMGAYAVDIRGVMNGQTSKAQSLQ
jgi:acetyltransferase